MMKRKESRIARTQRLAKALADLPVKICIKRRAYNLDIDSARRRVEYVTGNYIAASFTCETLADAAEAMLREFIQPMSESKYDDFVIPEPRKRKEGEK